MTLPIRSRRPDLGRMVADTRIALAHCEGLLRDLEQQGMPEPKIGPYRTRVGQLRDELTMLELMLGGWPPSEGRSLPDPPWQSSRQTPCGKSPPPPKSTK